MYPQLKCHQLKALIDLFALQAALDARAAIACPPDRRHYHCALYDALASALLLRRLAEEPALNEASLHWLFQHSAASNAARDSMGQRELF
jgi:DNA polymerase-3 subunit epsilon